jgi:asparagine synthetase B (glutamine-hydrolysing)
MCGIAGVRRFGKTPITGEELVAMLCALEHRGLHATGLALVNPDGIHVLKAPIPAWKYTRSKEFEEFIEQQLSEETEIALLHTRWATVGNPIFNENNHPMWDGETAVVHNGSIGNAGFVFNEKKYKKTCETDSDIIRATVAEHGFTEKGIRELSKLSGSAAIACVSTKYPGKLLIGRSGSPLCYGFDETGDKLYWASEAQAIIKAAKPYRLVRNVWVQDTKCNIAIGSMPDNTVWLFGPTECEMHMPMTICTQYRQPDYSKGRENYHQKTKAWKREARFKQSGGVNHVKDIVVVQPTKVETDKLLQEPSPGAVIKCPGCGVGVINKTGKAWKDLQCGKCKSALA